MPDGNVESTFGVRTLTTSVRTFDTKSQDSFFTDKFRKGRPLRPEGRKVEWDEIRLTRALAPVVGLTSPAPKTGQINRQNRDSAMMLVKLSRDILWDRLFLDRHAGELKPNAKAVIMDELADMTNQLAKTREYAAAQVLKTGGLVVNAANIPGSDQTFTLDFAVNTYAKNAAWSTAGTSIWSDEIPRLLANTVAASAIPAKTLIVDDITARYILANTEVQKFGATTNLAKEFLGQSAVPELSANGLLDQVNIGGMNMVINPYGYDNTGSNFTRWLEQDKAIALPADPLLPGVLGWAEGQHPVPSQLWGQAGDVGIDMLGPGPVAWAKRKDDPMVVTLYLASYFLPVILFPEAVTFATLV